MSTFPVTRLRRLRRTSALRDLVRETRLDLDDFVMPLFVGPEPLANDGAARRSARYSVDDARAPRPTSSSALGVKAVILFGIPDEKDDGGSGAWDDDGIVQRALRALRPRFPSSLLLTDVCLCEYTSHGHCGVIGDGERSTTTRRSSCSRAPRVSHVEAGADVVCAERHDGRPRRRDPRASCPETPIVAYSAKYASAFYGPFREAAESAPVVRRPARLPDGSRATCARRCASASSTSPRAPTC